MNSPAIQPHTRPDDAPHRFVQGILTSTEKADFLFGPARLHSLRRLNPAQKAQISTLMAMDKLDPPQMTTLIQGLSELASHAGAQITTACYQGDQEALAGNTPAHWEIKELLLDEILNRSPHHPATAINLPTQQDRDHWHQTTVNMLIDHLEDGTWEEIPDTLIGIDLAARYYNDKGAFPQDHSPHDTARHYSDPTARNWQPGANSTNPNLPDLHDPNPELASYIRLRHTENRNSFQPITDQDFLERMIRPYLPQRLIASSAHSARPQTEPQPAPGLEDDADNPDTHVRAAYTSAFHATIASSRALSALAHQNHQAAADTLHEITDHLAQVQDLLQTARTPEHTDTMWQQGIRIWPQLAQATQDFRDLAPLCQLTLRFTAELHSHRETEGSEVLDTVHFQAAQALNTAVASVAAIQSDLLKEEEREKVRNNVIAPAEEKAAQGQANQAMLTMLDACHQREAAQAVAKASLDQASYPQADQALDDMADAGISAALLRRLESEPTFTARLDTAVKSLQHADFIINALHQKG